ncbi:MAG: hypothetical protein MJ252_04015, partial [archaeon]|nr:hypothetical protein [archaeon]
MQKEQNTKKKTLVSGENSKDKIKIKTVKNFMKPQKISLSLLKNQKGNTPQNKSKNTSKRKFKTTKCSPEKKEHILSFNKPSVNKKILQSNDNKKIEKEKKTNKESEDIEGLEIGCLEKNDLIRKRIIKKNPTNQEKNKNSTFFNKTTSAKNYEIKKVNKNNVLLQSHIQSSSMLGNSNNHSIIVNSRGKNTPSQSTSMSNTISRGSSKDKKLLIISKQLMEKNSKEKMNIMPSRSNNVYISNSVNINTPEIIKDNNINVLDNQNISNEIIKSEKKDIFAIRQITNLKEKENIKDLNIGVSVNKKKSALNNLILMKKTHFPQKSTNLFRTSKVMTSSNSPDHLSGEKYNQSFSKTKTKGKFSVENNKNNSIKHPSSPEQIRNKEIKNSTLKNTSCINNQKNSNHESLIHSSANFKPRHQSMAISLTKTNSRPKSKKDSLGKDKNNSLKNKDSKDSGILKNISDNKGRALSNSNNKNIFGNNIKEIKI